MEKSLIVIFLFISLGSYSQETRYYNKYWQQTLKVENADYMGVFIKDRDVYEAKFYHKSGELQSEGRYIDNNYLYRTGEFKWYYKSGKLKAKSEYQQGVQHGKFIGYYENGQSQFENIMQNDTVRYTQIWLPDGKELLENGTGAGIIFIPEYNQELNVVVEDSIASEIFEVRPAFGDSIYYKADVKAEPKKGNQHFYNFMKKKISYPVDAYRKGEEAIVYVSFIVNKSGLLTEFTPYYAGEYSFNEEVVAFLRSYPSWKPGMNNGKPVKMKFVLDIRFKTK